MNKMSLTPNAQRPAPAELLSQLGQLSQSRGAQDGAEAAGGFARLLQANAGNASRPAAPLAATPAPAPRVPDTPHAAAPTPRPPANGAPPARTTAADSDDHTGPTEPARRQDGTKATGRRTTEGAARSPSTAADDAQDPVLAHVLRHLRGDSLEPDTATAELAGDAAGDSAEDTSDADEPAGLPGGLTTVLPLAQATAPTPGQELQRLTQAMASAADGTEAVGTDSPARGARGAREARLSGVGDSALPGSAAQGAALPGAGAAAQATDAAADGLQALAVEGVASAGQGAGALEGGRAVPGTFASALQQVQPGLVSDKAANTPAVARYDLHAPVHSPGFAPEMAARLSLAATEGVQQAQLHLNPAEMGPVQVQIVLDGQQAQVSFVAEQADTRAALEKSLPELAGALREQGLTLSGGGVFSQQQQAQSGQPGQADTPGSRAALRWAAGGPDTGTADDATRSAPRPPLPRARGVLDLFA